ncbi:glycosyl transferase family 41-domain-containing protein [Baffinella frigidus]|nr:glycosyl transferase family 41-domain-containing protein [Cryptophyta sp. CCMP2293]
MYKIQPDLLDAWCRALATNEKGVLWLLRFPESAVAGIEREFSARCSSKGVNASRLVLSTLLPAEEHIVAKGLADFALDTLPFNGHTTGADTLWAGVPLISLPGDRIRNLKGAGGRGRRWREGWARPRSSPAISPTTKRARERLRERVWGAATANGGTSLPAMP